MHDLTLTLVQTSLHWGDAATNLEHFSRLLSGCGNSDIVILPEMFNTGFITEPASVAETMRGPTLAWMRRLAKETGSAICGSLIIREEKRYFNRLIFMMPGGKYLQYDKRHLFSMAGEHRRFTGGTERTIIEYKGWNILPLVCYDLRFPVWSRNTYRDGAYGYDLLIYIANWPEVRSHAWKSLAVARAIENLSYVAAVNRVGRDGNSLEHSGDSVVLDAKGHCLLSVPPHRGAVMSVTISASELQEFRRAFNAGPDWDRCRTEE